MTLTNCLNCGAPLHNEKCQYCGTEYGEKTKREPVGIELSADNTRGVLSFMGVEFDVYLESVETHNLYESCRSITGESYNYALPPSVEFVFSGTPRRKER